MALGQRLSYLVLDLGTLPLQSHSGAIDINSRGQVVGWSGVRHQATRGFLWQNGKMQDLGIPHGSRSGAVALNDQGDIVGWSGDDAYTDSRAFFWKDGRAQALGTLPGYAFGAASGINNRGEVVGSAYNNHQGARSSVRAFVWKNGRMIDVGTLPEDDESAADDINARGQIVGYSRWYNYFRGYVYRNGQMRELRGLGDGKATYASAINNKGVAAGTSTVFRSGGYFRHACVWSVGAEARAIDLGTLGGGKSAALDINDLGQVVGWSYVADDNRNETRAFSWQYGRMHDLNALIPPDLGWILESADGINNQGQIVGTGLHEETTRAFLLSP
jgi:probable HAF family extracellular repeat protein